MTYVFRFFWYLWQHHNVAGYSFSGGIRFASCHSLGYAFSHFTKGFHYVNGGVVPVVLMSVVGVEI